MIPLNDNVPTRHLPILTMALIVGQPGHLRVGAERPDPSACPPTSASAAGVDGFTAVTAEYGFVPCELTDAVPPRRRLAS